MQPISLRRMGDQEQSFIMHYFEDFYSQVANLKRQVQQNAQLNSQQDNNNADLSAPRILSQLKYMLEQQALSAGRHGGEFAAVYYHEAQYIMVVLADEVFLNFDWPGREYWEDHLLESQLFGTHDAGDLFFQRLDEFLRQRDSARQDLAEIYLLALGLGFQGRYRGQNAQGRLATYKNELYTFINHRELHFYNEHERLFPEAYAYTLSERTAKPLRDTRLWYTAFVATALVVLICSHIFWRQAVGELDAQIDNIDKRKLP